MERIIATCEWNQRATQEKKMNSKAWTRIIGLALFAALALAMPIATIAQDNTSQNHQPKHHTYRLVDLGTFGGPGSRVTEMERVLNNHGTVVGGADTPSLNPYACFNPFNAPDCHVQHAFEWQDGRLIDLGTLPGGSASFPYWISGNGIVAGGSELPIIDPNSGTPEYHAVLWRDRTILDLGTLGGTTSLAVGVNNQGQATGVANNTIPDPFSSPPSTEGHAFLWAKGKMHDLGTLGGPDSFAQYINDRGQMAGVSFTSYIADPNTGLPQLDPFLWENGTMKDLGNLGGQNAPLGPFVSGLNNRGQVVGSMVPLDQLTQHAFLWDGQKLNDLGALGKGDFSEAAGINDAGVVIGRANRYPGQQDLHAVLWKDGKIKDLGTVNGDPCSVTIGINSQGQIVGASQSAAGGCNGFTSGFLWEHGGPSVDLNALLRPSSSLQVNAATDINDHGEIAGFAVPPGCTEDMCQHAILLIPDGDCDDDCEARIATSQNTAAVAVQANPTINPINVNTLHNRFGRPAHLGTGIR